jgi:hypothetical protein
MEPKNLKRRTILGLIAACLPVSRAASALDSALAEPGRAERLIELFSNPSSAAAVGAAYLDVRGGDADAAALFEEFVGSDAELQTRLDGMTQHELRTYVRERVREDFLAGRTRSIDGWVLSHSELLLYGLAAVKIGHA